MVPAYQPIVDLTDESVVGFEALARWPRFGDLGPQAVFAHARDHGDIDLLDQVCIDVSVDCALRTELPSDTVLSVNCEPASSYRSPEPHHALSRAKDQLQVMFEITERRMLWQPQLLLRKVAALRNDGFLIALDDVGAHPDSSALLDIIAPDVMKLDLALVQSQPNYRQAQTLSAVMAHHERTGAVILAEGIETDEHLEQALALGADLGQGYLFGAPGTLTGTAASSSSWSPTKADHLHDRPRARSPFELIEGNHRVRTARKETVVAFSKHIETQAQRAADPPMVLTALQHSDHLTPATMRRYLDLAARSPLVAVFGESMAPEPGDGIRGVALRSDDPLCSEWSVITLGPHTAAALIARERPGGAAGGDDSDRRFDFVITYERDIVTATARNLLDRMR
ncbi:MAG: diguanylate phosphodiesterase [Mycobacterium sp.]|nr:diguanylate phosphodiesterase [Mycobacterium sp.]